MMATAFLLKTIIVLDPVFKQLINNHECDGGSDTDRRLFTSTADDGENNSMVDCAQRANCNDCTMSWLLIARDPV